MFWAESLGTNYIYSRLVEWSKTYGDFFKPCSYLEQRAKRGISLVRIRPNFLSSALLLCVCIFLVLYNLNCNYFHYGCRVLQQFK